MFYFLAFITIYFTATVECSGSEPAATDRKIIFTAMCRTAFLFGCNDNSNNNHFYLLNITRATEFKD